MIIPVNKANYCKVTKDIRDEVIKLMATYNPPSIKPVDVFEQVSYIIWTGYYIGRCGSTNTDWLLLLDPKNELSYEEFRLYVFNQSLEQ